MVTRAIVADPCSVSAGESDRVEACALGHSKRARFIVEGDELDGAAVDRTVHGTGLANLGPRRRILAAGEQLGCPDAAAR